MNKIWLDNCAFCGPITGGISTVWYELLIRLMSDNKFELNFIDVYTKGNKHRELLHFDNYKTISDPLFPLSQYLPFHIKEKEKFIFHSPYYRYCPTPNAINITTVHDFTYELYRGGLAKTLHCFHKYRSIRHSDYIVCISENTKKDLLFFLPDIDESKIRIVYNGVSEDYKVLDRTTMQPQLPFPPGSYLVFIGGRGSYKNFDFVKKHIGTTKYNLVIVGNKLSEEEKEDLKNYLPENRFASTGFLANDALNVIYNYAAALVYPSSYEGFGIPVIEAQKAGCPVIAYNASSIPEVIGETPLLMNELTKEEFERVISVLDKNNSKDIIVSEGIRNSKRFSWDKMFSAYMDIYEEIRSKNSVH